MSRRFTVPDYDGRYFVTDDGQVFSNDYRRTKKTQHLRAYLNKDGYHIVGLTKGGKTKLHRVHRLVAEAFIPNPYSRPHVNHKNANKLDNRACNLEWVTPQENVDHTKSLNHFTKGENRPNAKLKDVEADRIFLLRESGMTQEDIANMLGVSRVLIWSILTGTRRRHQFRPTAHIDMRTAKCREQIERREAEE